MFKSAKKKTFSFYIKELMWPSMGWKRAGKYIALRVMRLSATSDSVPRGIACGLCISFFPIFGVHAILAMAMAFIIRANVVAAGLGTLIVPPVILPLVFSLDFLIGRKILNWSGHKVSVSEPEYITQTAAKGAKTLIEHFDDYFLPAFVGSVIFMVLVWPAAYMATHKVIDLLKHRHAQKKKDTA